MKYQPSQIVITAQEKKQQLRLGLMDSERILMVKLH